jgi:cytochrome c oxidase subunit 2
MGDMLRVFSIRRLLAASSLLLLPFTGALADQPRAWELNFQEAQSPVMERVVAFHDLLLIIITLITLFVLALLVAVIVKFNEKDHPVPSKTTHNGLLEFLWTAIPVVILVVIAIPSFRLLYFMDKTEQPDLTLKIIGHQWYWSYEYPDHGDFTFDARMVPDEEIKPGQPRLLATDNKIVLPIDSNIRLQMTSTDVIHAWAIPALVHKLDAVPGRINETWMRINKPGTYYGQCSELCGVNHGFMPIEVEAVTKEQFARWVAEAKTKFAKADGSPADGVAVAQAAGR